MVDEALPLLLRRRAIETHVVAAVLPLHIALRTRALLEDCLEQVDQVEALPAGSKAAESTTLEAASSSTLKQWHGATAVAMAMAWVSVWAGLSPWENALPGAATSATRGD